jgi:uncharacterized phage infection (PIP) family protein YhgE
MKSSPLLVVTLVLAACSPSDRAAVRSDAKELGHDAAQAGKDAGHAAGESLSEGVEALDRFARAAASNVAEGGEQLAQDVSKHMPDVETLADEAKAKLAQGGAEAKAASARLDNKLAVLKDKLAALGRDAAHATKEMKDGVLTAFNDVVDEIRSGLSKTT